ncbi:hypothetical protein [Streptomyces niphimycinicus]|nr:hypothetical protein [Streptomyces niphimycinicus]
MKSLVEGLMCRSVGELALVLDVRGPDNDVAVVRQSTGVRV